jgi:hypothetical protein
LNVRNLNGACGVDSRDLFGAMGNMYAGGICVVAASKDGHTEYWAAATPPDKAVAQVLKSLPLGWKAVLTMRRIAPEQVAALNLRPNTVCKLRSHE